jgi:predicted DNA-binding transcriptional regulator AlpA
MNILTILPRILRAKQAPGYLGMCRDEFNKTVRPFVREFPIGQQGVGFDRIELDQWADAYIAARSIDKRTKLESTSTLIDNSQSMRKKRGPVTAGWTTNTPAHKPTTSEDFYTLVDEILGRSADKKVRGRKKQENQKQQTEE